MLSKLNTLLVKVEGVMNALIKIMYMVMNNQYLICPPLLIRLMVGELNLLRTVNIFRSLEPIPYLRKGQDIKKKLLQQFTCTQWQMEYVLILRENAILKSRNSNNANISVGYIVIVKSDSTKRIFWKLTKVEELFPRKDGQIRSAKVKVANSEWNTISVQRVIQHLIQLEVTLSEEIDELGHYEKAEEHRHREREGRCGWTYKQLYTTATKDSPVSRDCMLEEKH